jgi:ribosomal protein S18 acetylase RimI-like enzyme
MSAGAHIRPATAADVDALVRTIVSAEKSGTDLATLFDLSETQAKEHIASMLHEEVDGCELSISSFLLAEVDGRFAGAVGGWVEAQPDDMPSGLLKSNLIGATYPEEAMQALRTHAEVLTGLRIERAIGALQIEYVHVEPDLRGRGIAQQLITAHLDRALASEPRPTRAQVQAFADNAGAVRVYQQLGFAIVRTYVAEHPLTSRYLPFHQKVLMERAL